MNQQPDKLFREKLEGYQKPAPASAWNKIEANLDNKSPKGLWWKIAASLLLLAVATYILWPKTQATEKIIAKKVEEVKPLPAIEEDQASNELPATNETPISIPKSGKENNVAKVSKENHQPKEKIQEPTIALEESIVPVESKLNEDVKATENIIVPEVVVANTETTEKSTEYITIVVTADEANKYLIENSTTQATSVAKKPSTLRKLLKQASELADDQSPLADLRQKKDEILALNFDSKKQRGQNK